MDSDTVAFVDLVRESLPWGKKSTCMITKSRQPNSTQSIKLSTKKMDGKDFAVVECFGFEGSNQCHA